MRILLLILILTFSTGCITKVQEPSVAIEQRVEILENRLILYRSQLVMYERMRQADKKFDAGVLDWSDSVTEQIQIINKEIKRITNHPYMKQL